MITPLLHSIRAISGQCPVDTRPSNGPTTYHELGQLGYLFSLNFRSHGVWSLDTINLIPYLSREWLYDALGYKWLYNESAGREEHLALYLAACELQLLYTCCTECACVLVPSNAVFSLISASLSVEQQR